MSDNIVPTIATWQKLFKQPEQLREVDIPMLVKGFLPPGVTFITGPSGHGKSWLALSLAKALYFGQSFLGYFEIPKRTEIIYLIPEVSESSFKQRLRLLGLGDIKDGFYCQTLSDGTPIDLKSPNLKAAIKDLNPVIFLDTAARFNKAEDENDAMQSKKFADNVFGLLQAGAQAVIPIHHSSKSLAEARLDPTLENSLRGSGDLGAMSDAVYCMVCSDKKNFISEVCNVKARDFTPVDSFEIQGRPFIDQDGDLKLIRAPEIEKDDYQKIQSTRINGLVINDPNVSLNDIAKALHIRKQSVKSLANIAGWYQRGRTWKRE